MGNGITKKSQEVTWDKDGNPLGSIQVAIDEYDRYSFNKMVVQKPEQ